MNIYTNMSDSGTHVVLALRTADHSDRIRPIALVCYLISHLLPPLTKQNSFIHKESMHASISSYIYVVCMSVVVHGVITYHI